MKKNTSTRTMSNMSNDSLKKMNAMQEPPREGETPLFVLKPAIGVAVIPTILGALIFGIFISIWVGVVARSIIAGVLTAITIIVLALFFHLMNLSATRYLFFKNKAEFYDGFLTVVHRTIPYNRVTDCVLIRSVWGRMFGTGTIQIVTAGFENGGRSFVGAGITMKYVRNPEEVYNHVRSILGTN